MQSTRIDVEAQARAGIAALQRGDLAIARDLFEQVTSLDGATPQLRRRYWAIIGVGSSLRAIKQG